MTEDDRFVPYSITHPHFHETAEVCYFLGRLKAGRGLAWVFGLATAIAVFLSFFRIEIAAAFYGAFLLMFWPLSGALVLECSSSVEYMEKIGKLYTISRQRGGTLHRLACSIELRVGTVRFCMQDWDDVATLFNALNDGEERDALRKILLERKTEIDAEIEEIKKLAKGWSRFYKIPPNAQESLERLLASRGATRDPLSEDEENLLSILHALEGVAETELAAAGVLSLERKKLVG